MTFEPLTVLFVEDEQLFREALGGALAAEGFEITAVGTVPEALRAVRRQAPHVAVLDIRLGQLRDAGLQIAEILRREHPHMGLVVLSAFGEISYARRLLMMDGGSHSLAYLTKDRAAGIDGLRDAIERVAAGDVVIDEQLYSEYAKRPHTRNRLSRLTDRERETLSLVAQAYSNKAIGEHMGIEGTSVNKYLTVIYQKLGLPLRDHPDRDTYTMRVLAVLAFLEGE